MPNKKAIVIGSGIAGLAMAIRLRALKYEVLVLEQNSYYGGKLTFIEQDGFTWDAGPSLFTLPHLVDELFSLHGVDPEQYFQYQKVEKICKYFWEDGTQFEVSADPEEFVKQASETFGEPRDRIRTYIENAAYKYETTAPIFLERSLHKWQTYFTADTLNALSTAYKLNLFGTLNDLNEKKFNNPKLIQLFNRYATYNGSSPYKTPGIMSMIPHLEMDLGTFIPKGGMRSISDSLYRFACDLGVEFRFDSKVDEILSENKVARGVISKEETLSSDLVVSNMDIWSSYHKLLPEAKKPEKILKQERSSSALIFYWGMSREFPELDLHNIFFSSNYREEFEYLFDKKSLYHDPTVYINITSKYEQTAAPKNKENWFVMINAPTNVGQDWEAFRLESRANIIKSINQKLGMDISSFIETETYLDPPMIESKTSSHQGSLYGAASNDRMAAFLRHSNFSKEYKNLYFCGGSVHPGGGIPLCLLSAKIVSDWIPEA
ncbi:phytoene desaturase [bacterium]|nr:phytoene desaturase [bacterium]